jgi:hypothetical protein
MHDRVSQKTLKKIMSEFSPLKTFSNFSEFNILNFLTVKYLRKWQFNCFEYYLKRDLLDFIWFFLFVFLREYVEVGSGRRDIILVLVHSYLPASAP